jgi:hypothetical protein
VARPALERAHPSGAVAGTFRPVERAVCDVLMEDGHWGHAEAMGWAQDISGMWRIQLLYYDAGSQREDWWLYDPSRIRLAKPALTTANATSPAAFFLPDCVPADARRYRCPAGALRLSLSAGYLMPPGRH